MLMSSISPDVRRRDCPAERLAGDDVVEPLALRRRNQLRIADAGDVAIRIEHDRGRDDGAGQTAAPHFVAAGYAIEPPTPHGVFEGPHRMHSNHGELPTPNDQLPEALGNRESGVGNSTASVWCVVSFILAALPFRLRRKYSLARRTRADRTTSTLAIDGECSGKMRSTPWPNDTLRTVNDARAPPRCMPMTMPSKIWMRSLSPSRTFTCTRTVSPDFMAGRVVSCDFSTSSIALIVLSPVPSESRPASPLLVVERRRVQQLRTPLKRPPQRRHLPPPPNLLVVPRQQHVGHFLPGELRRARVVRVIEQPARKRVLFHRPDVADHARHQPADRVDHDQRRQLAAAQHVIANRQLVGRHRGSDPLVHPFVSAAEQHEMRQRAHPHRLRLREFAPLRRQQHHRAGLTPPRPDVLHRARQRLRLHHHPRPAAVRHVVHAPVPIGRVVSQVVDLNIQNSPLDSAADHPFGEAGLDHPRKDRHDVEFHVWSG